MQLARPTEITVGPEELKGIITRLYGSDPGATGQIRPDRVYGRSFVELASLLAAEEASNTTAAPTTPVTVTTGVTGSQPAEVAISSRMTTAQIDTSGNTIAVAATPISGEEGDRVRDEVAVSADPNTRLRQLIDESNWIIFAMLLGVRHWLDFYWLNQPRRERATQQQDDNEELRGDPAP